MRLPKGLKLRVPLFWRFQGLLASRKKGLLPRMEREMYAEFQVGFRDTYKEVLRSLTSSHEELPKSAFEPSLLSVLVNNLTHLKDQKQQLHLVNPEAAVSLVLCNAKLHINISTDRKKYRNFTLRGEFGISDSEEEIASDQGEPRLRSEDMIVYSENTMQEPFTSVLVVDCVYHSCMKLVLKDSSGKIIRGQDNLNTEKHAFRFETEFSCDHFDSLIEYYLEGEDDCPITNYNWTLSDIDFVLRGNPLAKMAFYHPVDISDED